MLLRKRAQPTNWYRQLGYIDVPDFWTNKEDSIWWCSKCAKRTEHGILAKGGKAVLVCNGCNMGRTVKR